MHTNANMPRQGTPISLQLPTINNNALVIQPLQTPLSRLFFVKHTVDLILSILLLVFTLPLFGLIALAIKLDSRGPVFFVHIRIGKNGKLFKMIKFRTMKHLSSPAINDIIDNDEALRNEWLKNHKLDSDPRVTKFGAFLRKTSFDELPQLFNVLRGDMSLIGPRPIVFAEVEKYGRVFQEYLRIKPGLTGLWQVSGRNSVRYSRRVALDAYYIRNWSLWLDFNILLKTPLAILKCQTS